MPGILPMKMIKVGSSNSQSRIAQACDRCRSKKIRCDGIRPCCSQCSGVGFECKTSDKLSRRAFPRGYTESLEERVRTLEAEIRDLKDLLDEKDEKMDILSKMHSNRGPSISSTSTSPPAESRRESSPQKEDTFRVQTSSHLLEGGDSDSYFMGASSGRAFIDLFKRKVQESGKAIVGFQTEAFLNPQNDSTSSPVVTAAPNWAPPRLFSDKCVHVFFQEWAPLFPVIRKDTFLPLYEEYSSHPEKVKDQHKLAQLHLVFAIAGLSADRPDMEQISLCESQWRTALDSILMENTISTIQCLILALLYCIQKGDYNRLQHYKGIAVGLSHRLGLHQSQKRFCFDSLTTETRKRIFWTLYTVDCFSASLVGLPKLLKEDEIYAEYPLDADDEHVTENGYESMLPGEPTRISSALALFRCSGILSKVLEQNYPSAATHDLSLQSLSALEMELDQWSDNLPAHLKLTFVQGKPSTDITGNRSALLSLAYYYIRSLIHRPAVGSTLGAKASPSIISLADSSKRLIQITQLLQERNMTFSFCLNRNSMLTLCGFSLLYQGLDLKQEGKLMQESQRLVITIIRYLERSNASCASDFKKLASSLNYFDNQNLHDKTQSAFLRTASAMSAPKVTKPATALCLGPRKKSQPHPYKHISASMSENDILAQQEKLRRATLPNIFNHTSQNQTSSSPSSYEGTRKDSPMNKRGNRSSLSQLSSLSKPRYNTGSKPPNLDYLSLSNTPISSQQSSPTLSRTAPSSASSHNTHFMNNKTDNHPNELSSLGLLLGSLENGQSNIHSAIYGGPAPSLPETNRTNQAASSNSPYGDWSSYSMWDDMTSSNHHDSSSGSGPAQSVFSFSGESHSSAEELSNSDLGMGGNMHFLPDQTQSCDDYLRHMIDEVPRFY
ncbi:8cdd596a-c629-4c11-8d0d-48e153a200af [Sclerotinia trifoliorum]|uniref:8cdd596a-c629-4c11-8d0d-48e153a200af n=1 Tax=Sclerotinia trifoliorum TaxID=28548 RepID=A0A8H2VQT5_9HELO|nr:8cdd596a-c629-4c11-8d0d-48e153a200af [Sclerotinia trifoliorum]